MILIDGNIFHTFFLAIWIIFHSLSILFHIYIYIYYLSKNNYPNLKAKWNFLIEKFLNLT
jgi:hypothetical protein